MKSKKMLKVFSFQSKQEILLPEECTAIFSTESSLVKMLLADIMEHVNKPFPCRAMIHLNAEIYQNPATAKKASLKNIGRVLCEFSIASSGTGKY